MGTESIIKSIRFEDQIIKQVGKDANFSALVNQAVKNYLKREVWLPNFQIEEYAGISAAQLLQRVKNVEYLRSSDGTTFTFYPGSEDEIKRNKSIYDYANGNFNQMHDGFVYFNIRFPFNLLMFLRSRTWEEVQRATLGALSLLYWYDEEKRNVFERQLEKGTIKQVIKIVRTQEFKALDLMYKNLLKKKPKPQIRAQFNTAYMQLATQLGVDPLLYPYLGALFSHIHHPFSLGDYISFESGYDIRLTTAYMRDLYDDTDDWHSIVVAGKNKNDNLHRAESQDEPWKNWKSAYSFYHSLW